MRLLLFGGSFNPVHIGHLIMAQEVKAQFGYDLVLFIPSLRPPHKAFVEDPGAEHRLEMLRRAVDGDAGMGIEDCEIRRGGTSYTIDTVRDIATRYPIEGKPGLIVGDDLIPGFATWKGPEVIASETDIVCAHRTSPDRLELKFPHRYADNPLIAVSSSLIRARAHAERSFRHFLPRSVYDYIRLEGLYGVR
ncbi:MAG: nicotinate (nicotinamide) nucleotide adenylyltransferase [Treponema sp.]|nr:nicotinate (nicotinamide) nucleotide adenylyltransferase [Treponema sp.]